MSYNSDGSDVSQNVGDVGGNDSDGHSDDVDDNADADGVVNEANITMGPLGSAMMVINTDVNNTTPHQTGAATPGRGNCMVGSFVAE